MKKVEEGISLLHFSLFFMFLFCPLVFSELPSNQRTTMIGLSNLLNKTDLSWYISKDPCSWNGVNCSSGNSSVTKISLSGFSLSSSDFLPLLCQIDSLMTIDVSDNTLTSIPEEFIKGCGKIGGLERLNISRNRLDGPLPTFHGFVGLKFLDLSFNFLKGNINLQLDGLIALKSLDLSGNHFSGLIPTNLGKAMVLEQLELSANAFEGGIPDQIMGYQNLTLIDLDGNRLSGPVPDRIKDLSKLEVLILSSNNFSWQIPAAISNIRTLSRFAANQNNFEGTIPSGITGFLKNLDLSYNKLSGSIPSDMLSPSNLQSVDLSYNLLNGSIPSNISPSLVRLRLGSNSLTGPIPSSVFGKLEKLMYLELDNNSLTGLIPPDLGSCLSLLLLNLAGNHLTGTLPRQLGGLIHLQVMKLQFNRLVGEIPVEIAQLQKLSTLYISWNLLNGSIPFSISGLRYLTKMNLQGNHLSGSIPDGIDGLDSLLELQLGGNQLTGKIPKMPASLQIALNLSSNLLVGPISINFLRLTGLEVLDLSNNHLTGKIPTFLAEMRSLTRLLLSNNQLSGIIPEFGSWLTLDVRGNEHLINTTTSNTSPKSAKKGKSVAASILIGFAAALLTVGVVTGLALSISRRYKSISIFFFFLNQNKYIFIEYQSLQCFSLSIVFEIFIGPSSIQTISSVKDTANFASKWATLLPFLKKTLHSSLSYLEEFFLYPLSTHRNLSTPLLHWTKPSLQPVNLPPEPPFSSSILDKTQQLFYEPKLQPYMPLPDFPLQNINMPKSLPVHPLQ